MNKPGKRMEGSVSQKNSLVTSLKTRVLLADDHERVRAGIKYLLQKAADIELVGEASDGFQTLQLVEELCPDVLLLDMEMPCLTGDEVARRLQLSGSVVRILVLSAYDDGQYVLSVLENGAAGYLTKDEAPEILINAVRGVARGEEGWISERVARQIELITRARQENLL